MMNAQVFFIEGHFSLIHIPLSLYSALLQPILQTLLPSAPAPTTTSQQNGHHNNSNNDARTSPSHAFLNISITPIECSIVCSSSLATEIFKPFLNTLAILPTSPSPSSTTTTTSSKTQPPPQIQISTETYNIFSVSSAGMEAGQRVMDLTSPLAMAGIPIFFITTYYTDFILVPSKDRSTVERALLERGFEFSEGESVFVAPTMGMMGGGGAGHSRAASASGNANANTNGNTENPPPRTPPPSNVAELQTRTFAQLRKRNVIPFVIPSLHLVQCSGRDEEYSSNRGGMNGHHSPTRSTHGNGYHDHDHDHDMRESGGSESGGGGRGSHFSRRRRSWISTIDARLYVGLITALVQQPRFLSVTLTQDDAPSLLLDKELLGLFGGSIAGDTDGDVLVPIFLDLVDLPLESTGIVCGVAGRLVEEMRGVEKGDGGGDGGGGGGGGENGLAAELSYLSTARAGAVILSGEGAERALGALRPLMEMDEERAS